MNFEWTDTPTLADLERACVQYFLEHWSRAFSVLLTDSIKANVAPSDYKHHYSDLVGSLVLFFRGEVKDIQHRNYAKIKKLCKALHRATPSATFKDSLLNTFKARASGIVIVPACFKANEMIIHYESMIADAGVLYVALYNDSNNIPEFCLEDWDSTFELVDMADLFAEDRSNSGENNHG